MTLKHCPYCRKKPPSTEKGIWPFCSTRCKEADLGCWSSEAYRVPDKTIEESELEEQYKDEEDTDEQ